MARYSEQGNHEPAVLDGFARCLHATAWADMRDRLEEEEDGAQPPYTGGGEVLDYDPPVTREARDAADHALATIQMDNGVSLADRWRIGEGCLCHSCATHGTPWVFGWYLAMEWLGHGVAWDDDHPEHGLEVGHGEFYYFSPEEAGDTEARTSPQYQAPRDEVEWSIECEPELFDPEDHFEDKGIVEHIRSELARGNDWAWCIVRVTARWGELRGFDVLGGCSYQSEAAFREAGDYYEEMCAQALAELDAQVTRVVNGAEPRGGAPTNRMLGGRVDRRH